MTNTCRDFADLLQLCLEQKCTKAWGVPTMVLGIAQTLKQNPRKFASFRDNLKTVGTGGTAIPPYVVDYLCKEWDIEVTQGWGMTECMPGTGANRINRRHHLKQSDEEQIKNQLIAGTPST
eukprot:477418_1